MATYILFWNPDISSYTKERFLADFAEKDDVGNWSFHEHEDVGYGDTFYMMKCGQGKCGLVMRGTITSYPYEDSDWSPKNRKHIFYADIEQGFTINPWSEAELLSPEILTGELPDFNWFGGHSGRKLDDEAAQKLDNLWFEYIDSHPAMFSQKEAWIGEYVENLIPPRIMDHLIKKYGKRCEICGYNYADVFGSDNMVPGFPVYPTMVISSGLRRLFFNACSNCQRVPNDYLAQKIKEK